MGSAAHALGTARIGEESEEARAYSAVALVLCGTLTDVLAPVAAAVVVRLWP